MLNTSVNFKDTMKVDHILESSLDVQSLVDVFYIIYTLSENEDHIQVVFQFPCLL